MVFIYPTSNGKLYIFVFEFVEGAPEMAILKTWERGRWPSDDDDEGGITLGTNNSQVSSEFVV